MSIPVMSAEEVAAASAKTTPAAPTVPTPAATEEKPEPKTIEALKAARRAAPVTETEKPKDGETTTTEPPKKGKTDKTVDVKIDEGSLAKFTKLNAELMAARKKIAELEPVAAKGAKVDLAMKMISEGKSFDGIRELVGIDAFNQAVKQVVGADDGKPPVSDEAKKLQEELEQLKKDNASTKEQLAAAAKLQRETGITKIIEEIKTVPDQFPYLSRSPDWARDALNKVDQREAPDKPSAYEMAEAHSMETNGRPMNDAEKNALIRAALEVAEEDHGKRAKLYAAPEPEKKAPKPATPRTIDRTMRTSVAAVRATKGKATLEQLKAERRGRA